MKIHIIGTVNGEENEGMRNIATHLGREFERVHTVTYSSLRDIIGIIRRSRSSDVTLVIARAIKKVYLICRIAQLFAHRLCVFLVQKPDAEFVQKCRSRPLHCDYFTLISSDAKMLTLFEGHKIYDFSVGINMRKFSPANISKVVELRKKYGFDSRPVILHVGHLSSGRGLKDFLLLDSNRYNLLVVASGMFEDDQIEQMLMSHGVRIIRGYLPEINELYQIADAYFFPTKSTEFVINIPLSVMEALACGTATVAYRSFEPFKKVGLTDSDGLLLSNNEDNIPVLVEKAVGMKSEKTFLPNAKSWKQVADDVLHFISPMKDDYK
jgi:glycosyltransferase involved in cell wall biosynthesis